MAGKSIGKILKILGVVSAILLLISALIITATQGLQGGWYPLLGLPSAFLMFFGGEFLLRRSRQSGEKDILDKPLTAVSAQPVKNRLFLSDIIILIALTITVPVSMILWVDGELRFNQLIKWLFFYNIKYPENLELFGISIFITGVVIAIIGWVIRLIRSRRASLANLDRVQKLHRTLSQCIILGFVIIYMLFTASMAMVASADNPNSIDLSNNLEILRGFTFMLEAAIGICLGFLGIVYIKKT